MVLVVERLSLLEMDMATQVHILNEAVFRILLIPLGKVRIHLLKIVWQTELFNFHMATSLEERKLWIQTC